MVRRIVFAAAIVLLALVLWRLLPEFAGGDSASMAPGGNPPTGAAGPPDELRIEISETAAQSEARHQEIIRRFGRDPAARAWVAECIAQGAAADAESWEFACWRAWGDQYEPADDQ